MCPRPMPEGLALEARYGRGVMSATQGSSAHKARLQIMHDRGGQNCDAVGAGQNRLPLNVIFFITTGINTCPARDKYLAVHVWDKSGRMLAPACKPACDTMNLLLHVLHLAYLSGSATRMGSRVQIRFDKGPDDAAVWFDDARNQIVARSLADVGPAFAQMQQALDNGHWLAGYASYELGYALEPRLHATLPEGRALPLICFGVYDAPGPAAPLAAGHAALHGLVPRWDAATYAQVFARLHAWIGSGDIYQANLTFPMDAQVSGTSTALYAALTEQQKVGHGALVLQQDLPDLLSRSPELFFRVTSDGQITTRPMKGTMPRGATVQEDAALRAQLESDPKIQAENLMIVDLLRNDISRLCRIGSVKVPELFAIETYATVHQMTSLVTGQLNAGHKVGDVFQALFPCGSITGAPKLRAMEIIRALEPWPRDAYCGAIGWFAPDGRADFNVAIRTLMVQDGRAVLNVGGGVVWDSTAAAEYEEALWKARYATAFHTEPA